MSDSDLIKLYSGRILELAGAIPMTGRLPNADGTAKRRSPLCGSTVTVDITIDGGRITDFRQDVKACALGQASASVVGSNIVGCTLEQIETARDQLSAMLRQDGPPPDAPFDDLKVLLPARDYKNRHASIMLALEASVEAMHSALDVKSA